MASTTHVITGGSGLLGASLILGLTANTEDDFVCLIRDGEEPAHLRLEKILRHTAESFALAPAVAQEAMKRSHVISSDVTEDLAGLDLAKDGGRLEFWHSAGLMLFSRKERERVLNTNVNGTRNVLCLAREVGAAQFNFFSTALVAPSDQSGLMLEQPVEQAAPRNPYEESKVLAEQLAREESVFPVRVMRPSIVIGHSRTLKLPAQLSGAYLVQRSLSAYQDRREGVSRQRVLALPEEELNLIPVDHVVRDAIDISLYGPEDGVFNLTSPAPPTVGDTLLAMAENCGHPGFDFIRDAEHLDEGDLLLQRAIGAYNPYINNPQRFDRRRTDAACRWREGLSWSPDRAALREIFRLAVV